MVVRDIDLSVNPAKQALLQALKAFHANNAELALGTKEMASQLGQTFDKVFADLVEEGEKGDVSIRNLFALLVVFNRLSRVCDQAKNICEETVFVASGKAKPPKTFRILFTDEKNDCLSQMACAIAQRDFGSQAEFFSAGWNPAEELDASFVEFMEAQGYHLGEAKPTKLTLMQEVLSDYHIIVNLGEDLAGSTPRIPYHTVLLKWQVAPLDQSAPRLYEQIHQEISSKVDELMKILVG
jgi:protein-tyrosine-phosphatase